MHRRQLVPSASWVVFIAAYTAVYRPGFGAQPVPQTGAQFGARSDGPSLRSHDEN